MLLFAIKSCMYCGIGGTVTLLIKRLTVSDKAVHMTKRTKVPRQLKQNTKPPCTFMFRFRFSPCGRGKRTKNIKKAQSHIKNNF